jgi:hypothetical protein
MGRMANGTEPDKDPGTGKFLPGNRASVGRGNPHADKVAANRKRWLESTTDEQVTAVALNLYRMAVGDDRCAIPAAREWLDRTLGKATPPADAVGLDPVALANAVRAFIDETDYPVDDGPEPEAIEVEGEA